MSLIYGDNFVNTTLPALQDTEQTGAFEALFGNCFYLTDASNLILPSNTAYNCYKYMFCQSGLTAAPALPATTLADSCYQKMFVDCTSLTAAPSLPATNIATDAYEMIFKGCSLIDEVVMLGENFAGGSDIDLCLYDWLVDTAATGTVYATATGVDLLTDNSMLPQGWTVQEYVS